MKVELIYETNNPELAVQTGARICYSKKSAAELSKELVNEEFLKDFIEMGHGTPLEHAVFTFSVEGISRACSHQLVRHRHISFNQKSQRYVDESGFDYVTPEAFKEDWVDNIYFQNAMEDAKTRYNQLVDRLVFHGMDRKKAQENARAVLPNACTTSLQLTMNLRELHQFLDTRLCNRAQDEIRELAEKILEIMKEKHPLLVCRPFPKCDQTGFCPEGKMGCGKHRRD